MSTNSTTNKRNGSAKRQAESNASTRGQVTHHDIRCRAYEIFCERIGGGGDHVSDWLQAEHELIDTSQLAAIDDQSGEPGKPHGRSTFEPQARSERVVHA